MPREVNPQRIALQDKILKARARGVPFTQIAAKLELPVSKVSAEAKLALDRMAAVAHDRNIAEKLEAEMDEVLRQAWEDHAASDKAADKAQFLRVVTEVVTLKAKLFGFETPGESKQLTVIGGSLAEIMPRLAAAER